MRVKVKRVAEGSTQIHRLILEIGIDSVVYRRFLYNIRTFPPPLAPPAKGGEFMVKTSRSLPLDGGGEVGVKERTHATYLCDAALAGC